MFWLTRNRFFASSTQVAAQWNARLLAKGDYFERPRPAGPVRRAYSSSMKRGNESPSRRAAASARNVS
jgi:hypothetical protein